MSTGDVGRAYIANTEQAENIVTNRLANTTDTGYNINRGDINGAENGSQAQAGGNVGVSGQAVTVSDPGVAQGLPGMDGRTDYRGIGEHLKQQLTDKKIAPIDLRTEHNPSSELFSNRREVPAAARSNDGLPPIRFLLPAGPAGVRLRFPSLYILYFRRRPKPGPEQRRICPYSQASLISLQLVDTNRLSVPFL